MPAMLTDIWRSFRCTPLWVQIWVAFLASMNLATIAFINQPFGGTIAVLSYAGMAGVVIVAMIQRGVSKAASIPHVLVWTPQILLLGYWPLIGGPNDPTYNRFLLVLLATNVISLAFDYIDSIKWLRGNRDIFRP